MKKLLIILCLAFLFGCTTTKPSSPVIVDKKVYIDSSMLVPCPLLEVTTIFTIEEALLENIDLFLKYALCARKQDDSIKLLKEFGNIKE